MTSLNNSEPTPRLPIKPMPKVWDLVISDMLERNSFGLKKYGMELTPNNGRKPLVDAYQEALDLVVYLRQEIYERYGE